VSQLNFALDPKEYTIRNAMCWGNFAGHCIKATQGKWGHRVVHVFITILLFPPIVSQIASLFEMMIVRSCLFKVRKPTRQRVRPIVTNEISDKLKKSVTRVSKGASPKKAKDGEVSPPLLIEEPPVHLPNTVPTELEDPSKTATPSPTSSNLSDTPSSDSETPVSISTTAELQLERGKQEKEKDKCLLM